MSFCIIRFCVGGSARPRVALRGVDVGGEAVAPASSSIDALMVGARLGRPKGRSSQGGDPLMFGRLRETAALDAAGIAFKIIPGISAAQGAAARLGVPLTRRRGARRFQAITGHANDEHLPDDFDWSGRRRRQGDHRRLHAQGHDWRALRELLPAASRQGIPAVAVFAATRARRDDHHGVHRNLAGAHRRRRHRRTLRHPDRDRCLGRRTVARTLVAEHAKA